MKFHAIITEGLTWSVVIDVPDAFASDMTGLQEYIYDNWGECEKDLRHDSACEIIDLRPYSEK